MFSNRFKRYQYYEYWPFWVFYGILTPMYLFYALKTKALAYFCNVNPTMRFGGFYDYPKDEVFRNIKAEIIPKTTFIARHEILYFKPFTFPFVAKPNTGERGKNVEIIHDLDEWNLYKSNIHKDLIVQEFIDFPLEFGIFYIRKPLENEGKIWSITAKEFLSVKGDGKSNLNDLIHNNLRSFVVKDELLQKFSTRLDEIIPKGEKVELSRIGNHFRGTKFLDASDLITAQLEVKVDAIMRSMNHFYYGRLDVKTKSIQDLQNGNFVILEINGANSEATQLYDPKYSVFQAWKIAAELIRLQYEVAKQNKNLGFDYPSWFPLAKALLKRITL